MKERSQKLALRRSEEIAIVCCLIKKRGSRNKGYEEAQKKGS